MAPSSAILGSAPIAVMLEVAIHGSVHKCTWDDFIAESSKCDAHLWQGCQITLKYC